MRSLWWMSILLAVGCAKRAPAPEAPGPSNDAVPADDVVDTGAGGAGWQCFNEQDDEGTMSWCLRTLEECQSEQADAEGEVIMECQPQARAYCYEDPEDGFSACAMTLEECEAESDHCREE